MTTFKKTELFVVIADWFDGKYFDQEVVYTDSDEAEKVANYIRSRSINPGMVQVLNISDYGSYCDDQGSERASYD